jgi:LPS O-antigen subunit length determinant protein (WzzB/FepE family)
MELSYKEYAKNPVQYVLFIALIVIGYMYYDNKSAMELQIKDLKEKVVTLETDYKELNDKLIKILQESK